MKGKNFLKVCGILMIIGGGLGVIISIIAAIGAAAVQTLATAVDAASMGVSTGSMWVAVVLAIVGSVLELVCGIVGCVNCSKPEKAMVNIVFGVLVVVIQIIALIMNFSVPSLITGFIVPALYLVGAFLNKQSAAE